MCVILNHRSDIVYISKKCNMLIRPRDALIYIIIGRQRSAVVCNMKFIRHREECARTEECQFKEFRVPRLQHRAGERMVTSDKNTSL